MILRHAHGLQRFVNTRFWQTVVVPHHAWGILFLAAWTTGLYLKLHQRAAATAPGTNRADDDEIDLSAAVGG
jgi:hypothetical protein